MDMENTAHTPPAFTGITLEAILSTENLLTEDVSFFCVQAIIALP